MNDLRQRYFDVLMEQVRGCRYPSQMMMDRLERAIADRESAEEYVGTLIDLLSADDYPSPGLLDRVSGLLDVLDGSRSTPG
jgi:hypothetical protein